MELAQLEYFVRVAQTKSFTKASIMLSVTQPALSKQIRRLEVELRQSLFNRNGRGISLTEEGTLFLDYAKGILEQVERARNALNQTKDSPIGRVIIATPPAPANALTANFITAFRKCFPRASLEIIEEKSRIVYEWLLMGRINIGFMYDPPESHQLEITPLRSHELFLIAPSARTVVLKDRPIAFRDLAKLPLILPSLPHSTRALVETEAAKIGIRLNVVLEIEGASLILALVQRGHGFSILPDFSLKRSKLSGTLQINEIIKPRLTRTLKMAISLQRPVTRLTRETVKLIEQHLGSGSDDNKR